MNQPKYSPQEAMERVKLMMKYDTSKTLTENKQIISEQPDPVGVGAATGGAITGALTAGAGAAATTAAAGLTGGAALAAGAGAVVTAPFLGAATAGALAGYGIYKLFDWIKNGDKGHEGFAEVMKACSASGIDKLVPKMSKGEIRQIAYSIEDAKGDWDDDEDAIVVALQKIESVADLCAVDKKIPGGLYNFLDNLTDSPAEWKMFTRPLVGMIEDTEVKLTPKEKEKVVTGSGKSSGKSGGYTPCSGTYKINCKSPKIGEAQACLGGLVVDNKFGPKTLAKLKEKGFGDSFTDADIAKICAKQEPNKPEISGEIGSIGVEEL